jgi:hypothetical protein
MTGFCDTLSRTFLDYLNANADAIRAKAELALSSIARIKSEHFSRRASGHVS